MTGHRQSRLPSTSWLYSPKEEGPQGWSTPRSTSEEAGARAGRESHIRASDTAGPAPPRREVWRPPDAGCRLLVAPTDEPVGPSQADLAAEAGRSARGAHVAAETASSARRVGAATEVAHGRLGQTGLSIKTLAASSAR